MVPADLDHNVGEVKVMPTNSALPLDRQHLHIS